MFTKFSVSSADLKAPKDRDLPFDFKVGDLIKNYNAQKHADFLVTQVETVLDDLNGEIYRVVSVEER